MLYRLHVLVASPKHLLVTAGCLFLLELIYRMDFSVLGFLICASLLGFGKFYIIWHVLFVWDVNSLFANIYFPLVCRDFWVYVCGENPESLWVSTTYNGWIGWWHGWVKKLSNYDTGFGSNVLSLSLLFSLKLWKENRQFCLFLLGELLLCLKF